MDRSEKRFPDTFRIFRRAGEVALETAEGETLSGKGLVTALRQESGEPGSRPHLLGNLSRPLYHFLGYLPQTAHAKGGVLTQAGRCYTVLDTREIFLGERKLCVRMLLEGREEDEIG